MVSSPHTRALRYITSRRPPKTAQKQNAVAPRPLLTVTHTRAHKPRLSCSKFNTFRLGSPWSPACHILAIAREGPGSPLLELESIALGALLRSYQRSSSAARPQHVQAAAHLFLHMLRHLSLMFTEVRPGGKGYLITVWVRPELGSGSGLGLGLGLGLGGSGRQGGTRRGSSPR